MIFKPYALRLFERIAPVYDPLSLTVGAAALSAAGTGVSAMGTIAGGKAAAEAGVRAQQAADFTAKQQVQAGEESRAVAQRSAFEKRREGDLLNSKVQARAAASGGGATDPGVLDISGDIAQRSEYDALFEMFKGENKARGLLDAAKATRMGGEAALWEGEAKKKASYLSAAGTIIGGAGSAFGKFGKA